MSALGGMRTPRRPVLVMMAALVMALAGCEYGGLDARPAPASSPVSPAPRSFEENAAEVVRLLEAPASDPGLPSEAEPAGKLSLVLAPGDYVVTGACAGVYGAKLTIVKGEGMPEASSFECDAALDRFVRHSGGPITISAVPPTGRSSATGVKVRPNTDRRASELEDFSEWSATQLQPYVPGESRGATGASSTAAGSLQAEPGQYELHFVCSGPPGAALSAASWAGAEVLAPVQVICDGQVFTTTLMLPTEGVDLTMSPGGGLDGRFAYKLVPAALNPVPPGSAGY